MSILVDQAYSIAIVHEALTNLYNDFARVFDDHIDIDNPDWSIDSAIEEVRYSLDEVQDTWGMARGIIVHVTRVLDNIEDILATRRNENYTLVSEIKERQ